MRSVIAVAPVMPSSAASERSSLCSLQPGRADVRGAKQLEIQRLLRAGHELHLRHILLMQRKLHPTGSAQDSRSSLTSGLASYSQRAPTPFRFPLPTPPTGLCPSVVNTTARRHRSTKRSMKPSSRSFSDQLHIQAGFHKQANPLSRNILKAHHYHKRVSTTLEDMIRSRKEIV
jgi:hypothetical protein